MNEFFKNVNAEVEMNPSLKYGDFRDWFIIDENTPRKIHETEIKFFINDELIYKEMMPINTKYIKFNFNSKVNSTMNINKFKWIVPEMQFEKETVFSNATIVTSYDTFNIDGEINFQLGDD